MSAELSMICNAQEVMVVGTSRSLGEDDGSRDCGWAKVHHEGSVSSVSGSRAMVGSAGSITLRSYMGRCETWYGTPRCSAARRGPAGCRVATDRCDSCAEWTGVGWNSAAMTFRCDACAEWTGVGWNSAAMTFSPLFVVGVKLHASKPIP